MTNEISRASTAEQPLESWKEIAAYLQRDVRTAKRWEKMEGLPVHRHQHLSRSSVYAYPSELEAWRANRQPLAESTRPIWLRPVPAFASTIALAMALMMAGSGPQVRAVAQAADGIVARQVWTGADAAGESVSPDGRYLAITHYSRTGRSNLAVRDLETQTIRYLTAETDGDTGKAVFSPDGSRLAYGLYSGNFLKELRIVARDGSSERVLLRGDGKHAIGLSDWSSDGKHLLGLRRLANPPRLEDLNGEIVSISTEDGSVRVVKSLGQHRPEAAKAGMYSPDGRYIACDLPTEDVASKHDIFLLASDGTSEAALVEHPAYDYVVGWAPDGSHLYFESDRTGDWSLWRVPVGKGKAEGPAEEVRHNTGRLRTIGFTTEAVLYYSLLNRGSDVYSADLDPDTSTVTGAPKPLIERFMGKNANPVWSPDGKRLAYYSMRGQPPTMGVLSVRDEETGEEADLHPKLEWYQGLSWFPEGRSLLAYGVNLTGTMAYFRIDAASGDVSKLLDIDYRGLAPWAVLSPDGKRLYNLGPRGLVEHDLVSGTERTVARAPEGAGFVELAMSSDGKLLASKLNWRGKKPYSLVVLPVDTGEIRELTTITPPHWLYNIAWTPDSKHILFTRQYESDEQRAELWRVSADTGEEQSLGLSLQGIRNLAVHPDGHRIAFTYERRDTEIWAMENFLPELEEAQGR